MIKKIKKWLALQRLIQIEVLETLTTICMYIDYEHGKYNHNPYRRHFQSHMCGLKHYSEELRKQALKGGTDNGTA